MKRFFFILALILAVSASSGCIIIDDGDSDRDGGCRPCHHEREHGRYGR
jgi:hypothetical protein